MYSNFKNFLKNIIPLAAILFVVPSTIPAVSQNPPANSPRIPETNSQGSGEMNQQDNQEPSEQQIEQNLERTLNIEVKDPKAPKFEEVPAPGAGDNVPTPPPAGEVEIQFPK